MKNRSKLSLCLISFLVVILSCCIVGMVALANSSNDEYVGEKYAPTITIDYGAFDENSIPNAVINTPYTLFKATAEDLFGEEIYTHTRVWLFYDSASRSLVNVENGTITPKNYGAYTVEFSAIDRWGNKTVTLYDFKCDEKPALAGDPGSDSNEYDAGSAIIVNDVEIYNAIGETEVSVKAVLKGNSSVIYDVIDGEFTPMYAGTYDIVYTLCDYNEKVSCSYEVVVNSHKNIVWQSKLELGQYYLAGNEYVLPEVVALSFADGTPKQAPITINVVDPSGYGFALESDRVFKPIAIGNYKITYLAEASGRTSSQSVTVKSVNVGFDSTIKVENYFIGDNVDKSINEKNLVLTTKTDGATVKFINPIHSRNVYLELSVVKESANNFDSFDVILTDAEDSSNSITINFAKNGETGGILSASGGRSTKTQDNFYNDGILAIEYDNVDKSVKLGSNQAIGVVKTSDGEAFDGFKGENVYVDIRFNGVIETAKIRVFRVANHVIYKDCGDTVAPDVLFSRHSEGDRQLGDIVTLDRIYVSDVLCPGFDVSYYVKGPNGKFVTDVNGLELSPQKTDYTKIYKFKLEEYGKYTITIKATDSLGNSASYTYNVNCVNMQSIKIEILDDQKTSFNFGDTVTVKSFEVAGFNRDELVVRMFYITPDEITRQIIDNKFVPDVRGEYQIWIYVSDVDGNLDMASYTITVS